MNMKESLSLSLSLRAPNPNPPGDRSSIDFLGQAQGLHKLSFLIIYFFKTKNIKSSLSSSARAWRPLSAPTIPGSTSPSSNQPPLLPSLASSVLNPKTAWGHFWYNVEVLFCTWREEMQGGRNTTPHVLLHPLENVEAVQVAKGGIAAGEEILWTSLDLPYLVSFNRVRCLVLQSFHKVECM
jgi:hypothetical protein